MRVWALGAALLIGLSSGACSDSDDASKAEANRSTTSTTATQATTATEATTADTAATTVGAEGTATTAARRSASGSTVMTAPTATTGATNQAASSATGQDATTTTSATPPTTGAPFQSQTSLRIQGRRFDPSDLAVGQRTRVTVTNTDAEPHTWTSDSGEWSSGRIVAGGSFTHSFARVGTFSYHCEIHSSMTGSVTVN